MIKKLISTAIVSSFIGSVSANPELGEMTLTTGKYQFFNATIAIDALPAELADKKLKVKLGSITDFYRHDIKYDKQVGSLRFKVSRDSNGKPLIRIRSVREITGNNLKAVVKLTVGNQKIYGIYNFTSTPGNQRQVTLNLLNSDHKPAEKPLISKKINVEPSQQKPLISKKVNVEPSSQKPQSFTVSKANLNQEVIKGTNTPSYEQYQVKGGQSISKIAMELLPRYPEVSSWRTLMKSLTSLNPEAFINGDINRLRADAQLKLPGSTQQIAQVVTQKPSYPTVKASETAITESSELPVIADSQNQKTPSNTPQSHSLNSTIIIKDLPESLAGKDNLNVKLGSITDFYRQGVEYNQQVAGLRFDITANRNSETVIRVHSNHAIDAQKLMAVVKFSTGRRKAYGIYEIRPGKTGRQITFNLLDKALAETSTRKESTPSSKTSGDIAKKQALEVLREKLKGYEQTEKNYQHENANKALAETSIRKEYTPSTDTGEQYAVSSGESVSSIAMKLLPDYPQVKDWRVVMNSLITLNPDAFVEGDINHLRSDALLTVPRQNDFEIEAENQELPDAYVADSAIDKPNPMGNKEGFTLAFANEEQEQKRAGVKHKEVYLVEKGDSLSVIAFKLLPRYQRFGGWYALMKELARLNRSVFVNNDIGFILAGSELQLPSPDAAVNEGHNAAMHKLQSQDVSAEQKLNEQPHKVTARPYDRISQSLAIRGAPGRLYPVPEGHTISMVAISLFPKFSEYGNWSHLMEALYELNPDAFIDNDLNQLRANAELRLPDMINP